MKKISPINESKRQITPDEILNFIGYGPFQLVAFLMASSTYLTYGCDVAILIFAGPSIESEWNITVTKYAILPAATCVPNVIGAVLFSILSDKFGRVLPYAVCIAWIGVFSVASAFSNSFYLLIGLRCMASLAIGGVPGFVNPTIVEFLPVNNRGKVLVLNTLIGSLGLCVSCGLAWWLIPSYPVYGWRYYVAASGLPTVFVVILRLAFYFESPRFLITKGKYHQAWKIFQIISKMNRVDLSEYASEETCTIQLQDPELHLDNPKKLVSQKKPLLVQVLMIFHPTRLRITLPLTVIVATESVGFITSQLFLPNFLKDLGVSIYMTMLVASAAQLLGSIFLSIIVEWPEIGRLYSFRLFATLSMVFFLLLTFFQTPVTIPVFLVLIYFSTAPILGLSYSYISEYYPTSIRSIATAYYYIIQALSNIVSSFAVSKAVNVPQHWLFPAVFASCYGVQLVVAFVLNYEPRGKKLLDKV